MTEPLGAETRANSARQGGSLISAARHASDPPADPVIVVTSPDEDCSPEAFHVLIDELLAGPEPELATIDASGALRDASAGR